MGNKKITLGNATSKYALIAGGAIITITSLFIVLIALGFQITGSDDICLGTADDPCISYGKICNLGPDNYDIYNPDNIKLDFSPTIKNYWMFFKDGRIKKEMLYSLGINASTSGWRYENFTNATKVTSTAVYVHRFGKYSCQEYMIVGLKENPNDVIKWGFGVKEEYLDPFWYGVGNATANISATTLYMELGSQINITANITGATTTCVDVDHPSYGINYTCGTPSAKFLFNVSYFRNKVFNDSTTSKTFQFNPVTVYEIGAQEEDPSYWETDHLYTLAHDGDYSTYSVPSSYYPGLEYYVNYTIPPNVNTSNVTWTVKDYNSTAGISIPQSCVTYDAQKIRLKTYQMNGFMFTDPYVKYYCYNSSGWSQILHHDIDTWGKSYLYEEEIVWMSDAEWPDYIKEFGLSVNALDEVYNISFNFTGTANNGSSVSNLRVKLNGTLIETIPLLMNGYVNMQNITQDNGDPLEETYNAIAGSCEGDFYDYEPCWQSLDWDDTTYSYWTGTGNITWVFKKPTSGESAVFNGLQYTSIQYYCKSTTDWIYMDSVHQDNAKLAVPSSCNNASLNNITIMAMTSNNDGVYEGHMIWVSDGSNNTFNMDGSTSKTETLRLPSKGTVNKAVFNVSGSYSEEFIDVTTATADDYGWVVKSGVEVSESFKPTQENLTAVFLHLYNYGATNFVIEVGTTAGGSEVSTNTFTPGDYGSGGGAWVKFDITDSVLSPGSTYYISLSAAGDSVVWRTDSSNPYADGSAYINGAEFAVHDFLMKTVAIDLTTDPKITIGALDTNYEWNATGNYTGNTQSVDLATNITAYLQTCSPESDGYCLVPFYLLSSTPGKLRVHDITINNTYNPNPIYLDSDVLSEYLSKFTSGTVNIPIKVYTDSAGNITINDVRIDYAGGNKTIDVLVWQSTNKSNNQTLHLINYFSNWDNAFPSYVNYLEFIPKSSTAKNVTPYGQTISRPIFNITNTGYGGMESNFSISINESYSCVNLTLSTNSNKSSGVKLNSSWLTVQTNFAQGETFGMWMWADYSCNYSSWKLWEPKLSLRNCCENCICSEDR